MRPGILRTFVCIDLIVIFAADTGHIGNKERERIYKIAILWKQ